MSFMLPIFTAIGSKAAVVSTGMSVAGSLIKGESQAQAYNYNAGIAAQNAQIAREQGEAAVQAQQRNAARRIGTMIANYGASGVQVDSGSPLDVLADSAAMATLDSLTIRYNYALKAAGFENQAALDRAAAKSSRTSGYFNAIGAGLSGYAGMKSMGFGAGSTSIPAFGNAGGADTMSAVSNLA